MTSNELFVAGTDLKLLKAIGVRFANGGWSVRTFGPQDLIVQAALDLSPSGILLDVEVPARIAVDQVLELRSLGYSKPIVMMSSLFDAPTIVSAIKRGADDFLQKPFRPELAFESITQALDDWTAKQARRECQIGRHFNGHALLTKRETDILQGIAAGATAKEAAELLELSPRTVEFYRARIMAKLGARNSADLMRIIMQAPVHA